jgi:hypothetical protein
MRTTLFIAMLLLASPAAAEPDEAAKAAALRHAFEAQNRHASPNGLFEGERDVPQVDADGPSHASVECCKARVEADDVKRKRRK